MLMKQKQKFRNKVMISDDIKKQEFPLIMESKNMLYCNEYDKDCSEVTSEECDNDCCDSCMYCVICTDKE